jgi:protein involved in polysaccharide export with SLBB domain
LRKVIVLLGLFLGLLGSGLLSQEIYDKKIAMIKALKDPSLAAETYVLGPGDKLQLDLWGNENATYKIAVSQDGTVFIPKYSGSAVQLPGAEFSTVQTGDVIPSLGEIVAEGLTLGELEREIQERVKKYYRGVNARISLYGLRSIEVSIHGSVHDPGVYAITPLYQLSHLIDLAGGITSNGSYRNIEIEGKKGTIDTFDLYQFFYKADMDHNPHILEGDVVMVPLALMSVKISGRVLRRGTYELKSGERLKELIEIAGGFQQHGSLTRPIKIYNIKNPDEVIEIDPYKLMIENDSLSNIELHTGDVITIPMEPFTVTVIGQVTLGGTFEYEPGADFNYYLGLAGGYGERANEGDIRITRWDGTRLKWKQGVEIKPGDTVVIGRSELKGWRDYLEVTLNAANLLFIIWTVSK